MPARPTAARGRESAGRSSSCRPTGSAVWGRGTSPRPSHPPVDRGSGRGGKPRPVAISSPSTSHAHALPVASPPAPPRRAPSSVAPRARRGLSPACPTGHCHRPVPVLCHGSDSTPMRRQLNWARRAHAGSSRAPHTQGSQRRTGTLHAAGPSSSVPGPASDTAGHLRAPPDSTPRPSSPAGLSSDLESPTALGPLPAASIGDSSWKRRANTPGLPTPGPPHLRTMPTHRRVPKTRLPPATRKVCRGTKEAAGPGEKQTHGHTSQPQPPRASEEPQPWAGNGFTNRQATHHGARFLPRPALEESPRPRPQQNLPDPGHTETHPSSELLTPAASHTRPLTFGWLFGWRSACPPGVQRHWALGTSPMAAPLRTVSGVLGALNQASGCRARLSPRRVLAPHRPVLSSRGLAPTASPRPLNPGHLHCPASSVRACQSPPGAPWVLAVPRAHPVVGADCKARSLGVGPVSPAETAI